MKPDFRVKLFLYILALFLATLAGARLSLFLLHREVFGALSSGQTVGAFLNGLRFDLATVSTFVGLPLLMLALPVFGKRWVKLWIVVAVLEFSLMLPLLVADVIFFDHVKRHIGDEIRLVTNDLGFIADFALKGYLPHLIGILAAFLAGIVLSFSFVEKRYAFQRTGMAWGAVRVLAAIFFLVMSIRGWTFQGKPINVIDAFNHGSSEYGNLVLNGVFTSYQSARGSRKVNHSFFENSVAIKSAREHIVGADEQAVDEKFPLMRTKNSFAVNASGYNVVILLLESWSPDFIDSFSSSEPSGHRGSGYGVTPNFDALAKSGLMFTNCYANGQRSIHGIASVLTGIPSIPGLPYLGKGLELADITRLGKIVGESGYSTLFVQTSERRSYRMEGISSALGFGEFYGKSDIPLVFPYKTRQEPDFGYDYDGLMFLKGRLDAMKKPFFAFFFSGATHAPYVLLDKKFEKYPHDEKGRNGYLNTLFYSDYSLGEFMNAARKTEWFDKTIFILTADHSLGQFMGQSLKDKFGVPLVIYCPGLFKPSKSEIVGSHADLMPTVLELLNIENPYSAVGKSLLSKYDERFAFFVEGDNVGLVTDKGYLKHSLKNRLESAAFKDGFDPAETEKLLLSIDQAVYTLIKENRWYDSARK